MCVMDLSHSNLIAKDKDRSIPTSIYPYASLLPAFQAKAKCSGTQKINTISGGAITALHHVLLKYVKKRAHGYIPGNTGPPQA